MLLENNPAGSLRKLNCATHGVRQLGTHWITGVRLWLSDSDCKHPTLTLSTLPATLACPEIELNSSLSLRTKKWQTLNGVWTSKCTNLKVLNMVL